MIYTVTLNPSIDYIVQLQHLQIGGLNRMNGDLKLPGGKGINVSRILNRLDTVSTVLGFAGGFTGRFIEECLQNESLRTDFVHIAGDTRINIKLKHGEETEINGQGPVISEGEREALFGKLSGLESGDIVVLSGSIPPSLGADFYGLLIGICKQKNAEFVIDTTGRALLEALPHRPLLVKPNHHELGELFGTTLESKQDIAFYGQKLLEQGAQNVLVSMAGEGAFLITREGTFHANVPAGKVRNSVGAGDSMIAGFIGGLTRSGDLMEAFRTGVACGSATAFSDDLAEKALIEDLLPQVSISPWA